MLYMISPFLSPTQCPSHLHPHLLSEVHHFIGQRLHLRNLPTDYLQLPMDLASMIRV